MYFSRSQSLGNAMIWVPANLVSGESFLLGLQISTFLLCPHIGCWKQAEQAWCLVRAQSEDGGGPVLTTSTKPHHPIGLMGFRKCYPKIS